jgi:hypothetical protein
MGLSRGHLYTSRCFVCVVVVQRNMLKGYTFGVICTREDAPYLEVYARSTNWKRRQRSKPQNTMRTFTRVKCCLFTSRGQKYKFPRHRGWGILTKSPHALDCCNESSGGNTAAVSVDARFAMMANGQRPCSWRLWSPYHS